MDKILSKLNSSNAVLSGNAIFSGTVEKIVNHESITITINSDVNSAADGITIYSGPSENELNIIYIYTYYANENKVINFKSNYSFFKITYQNGSASQSSFNLQTFYSYTVYNPIYNNDNPLHKNSMQYNQMKVGSKRNFSDL
jgi:hypothetical protein